MGPIAASWAVWCPVSSFLRGLVCRLHATFPQPRPGPVWVWDGRRHFVLGMTDSTIRIKQFYCLNVHLHMLLLCLMLLPGLLCGFLCFARTGKFGCNPGPRALGGPCNMRCVISVPLNGIWKKIWWFPNRFPKHFHPSVIVQVDHPVPN